MANLEYNAYFVNDSFKLSIAVIKYWLFIKSIPICNKNNKIALLILVWNYSDEQNIRLQYFIYIGIDKMSYININIKMRNCKM